VRLSIDSLRVLIAYARKEVSVSADIVTGGKEGKKGREKKDDMFFNECGAV